MNEWKRITSKQNKKKTIPFYDLIYTKWNSRGGKSNNNQHIGHFLPSMYSAANRLKLLESKVPPFAGNVSNTLVLLEVVWKRAPHLLIRRKQTSVNKSKQNQRHCSEIVSFSKKVVSFCNLRWQPMVRYLLALARSHLLAKSSCASALYILRISNRTTHNLEKCHEGIRKHSFFYILSIGIEI